MTEKRFKVTNISSNGMTGLFWLGNDALPVFDIVRLLNELDKIDKENEQLKKHIEYLQRKIQRERKSNIRQNEKWEKEATDLIREQRKFIDDLNKENEESKKILSQAVKQMEIKMDKNHTRYFVCLLIDIDMYKKIKEILND